jgi:hypothetical protein
MAYPSGAGGAGAGYVTPGPGAGTLATYDDPINVGINIRRDDEYATPQTPVGTGYVAPPPPVVVGPIAPEYAQTNQTQVPAGYNPAAAAPPAAPVANYGPAPGLAPRRYGGPARAPDAPPATLPPDLQPQHGGFAYNDPETYKARTNKWVSEAPDGDLAEIERRSHAAANAFKQFDAFYNSPLGIQGRIGSNQLAGMQKTYALQQQQGDAELHANQQAGEAEAEAAKQEAVRQAQWKEREDLHSADMQRRADDIQKLSDEVSNTKVDPAKFWKDGGALRGVMSVMAIGLGAFAQGWSGGKIPNTALNMLDKAVERDIQSQISNIANRRAGIADKRTLYAMARERFGDAKQAEMFARSEMWKQVAHKQRQYARGLADKRKRIAMEQWANESETKSKDFGLKTSLVAASLNEQQKLLAAQQAQARASYAAAMKAKAAQQAGGYMGTMSAKEQARYIPGYGVVLPGVNVEKLREEVVVMESASDSLAKLRQIMKKGSWTHLSPDERSAKAHYFANVINPAIKAQTGSGVTKDDERRIMPLFGMGHANEVQLADGAKALQRYENSMRARLKMRLRAAGVRRVDTRVNTDAKGNVVYDKRERDYGKESSSTERAQPRAGTAK